MGDPRKGGGDLASIGVTRGDASGSVPGGVVLVDSLRPHPGAAVAVAILLPARRARGEGGASGHACANDALFRTWMIPLLARPKPFAARRGRRGGTGPHP